MKRAVITGIVVTTVLVATYHAVKLNFNTVEKKTTVNSTYQAQSDSGINPSAPYYAYMDNYVFTQLTDEEKVVYDELYNLISSMDNSCRISTTDENVLKNAYVAVMADYGEIFWVQGYTYSISENSFGKKVIEVFPAYTMDKEMAEYYQELINDKISSIDLAFEDSETEYEKAKYLYTYLTDNVTYDRTTLQNQNIISVFLYRKSVCMGYASALQMLLDKAGIQSCIVTGSVYNVPHAWNLVRLDGNYYYMDATFGDSSFSSSDKAEYTNYNYFAMTTAELNQTHNTIYNFNLPICNSMEDNYYIREGLYFTEYNETLIGTRLHEAYQNEEIVSIKFSSGEIYKQFENEFIETHKIQDYCKGINTFAYHSYEDQNVITLIF